MTMASANRAPRPSSLADVLDVVLDKGIVIDAYVRVAVVGIELLTIDARIVIASVDTYLRFAEAVNRLDLQPSEQVAGLPGLMDEMREGGARSKTRGALTGAKEKAQEVIGSITGRGTTTTRTRTSATSVRAAAGIAASRPPGARPRGADRAARARPPPGARSGGAGPASIPVRCTLGRWRPGGWSPRSPRRPEHGLTDDDAVTHLDLLVALVAEVPVLPLPLGTTAPDDDAVREEVLTPAADQLERQLAAIADLVEVRLDLTFSTDALVADIAREDPDIARLAARARAPGAGFGDRMALGEAVAGRVADVEAALAEEWTAELAGLADRAVVLAARRADAADRLLPAPGPARGRRRRRRPAPVGGRGPRATSSTSARCRSTASWTTCRRARSPRRPRAGGGEHAADTVGTGADIDHGDATEPELQRRSAVTENPMPDPSMLKMGAVALGGYVLGRLKKGRAAVGFAMWAAGVKADPKQLLRQGLLNLASSAEGQQLLMPAPRTAARGRAARPPARRSRARWRPSPRRSSSAPRRSPQGAQKATSEDEPEQAERRRTDRSGRRPSRGTESEAGGRRRGREARTADRRKSRRRTRRAAEDEDVPTRKRTTRPRTPRPTPTRPSGAEAHEDDDEDDEDEDEADDGGTEPTRTRTTTRTRTSTTRTSTRTRSRRRVDEDEDEDDAEPTTSRRGARAVRGAQDAAPSPRPRRQPGRTSRRRPSRTDVTATRTEGRRSAPAARAPRRPRKEGARA